MKEWLVFPEDYEVLDSLEVIDSRTILGFLAFFYCYYMLLPLSLDEPRDLPYFLL